MFLEGGDTCSRHVKERNISRMGEKAWAFIIAAANLLSDSLTRRVLLARASMSNARGVVKGYRELLA